MPRIGYARVSSIDQDLDGQLARLQAEGCTIVRSEKVSGKSRDGRPELAIVLQFLRAGDELVVTRLDRLGRDTRDVLNLIYECEQRDASVTVLDPHVSTRGEMGQVVLTVLGMVAQMERRFIKERQREGIERAKSEGRYLGGRRRIDREAVVARREAGDSVGAIANAIGCSRMQVYRVLKGANLCAGDAARLTTHGQNYLGPQPASSLSFPAEETMSCIDPARCKTLSRRDTTRSSLWPARER